MKKRNTLLFLLILVGSITNILGQNNASWYFGNKAAIRFTKGQAAPAPISGSAMATYEASASITDPAGQLLFYTNGIDVWDRNNAVMPNGSGLKSHVSATQGALALRSLTDVNKYYVFTVDGCENLLAEGFRYSIVDMSLRDGLGDIGGTKNVKISTPSTTVTEKMTAVRHANGQDYWIVVHGWQTNEFYSYLFTASGLATTPVISAVGATHSGGGGNYGNANGVGQLKASPDGSFLACPIRDSQFQLLRFNPATGAVSNPQTLNFYAEYYYGAEFSPDGTKLYTTDIRGNSLYQIDLAGNFNVRLIARVSAPTGGLQLGPDGKIYMGMEPSSYLGVVSKPNLVGVACDFREQGVFLGAGLSRIGLPNMPNAYVPTPNFWTGNTSSTYTDPANWYGNVVPLGDDDVVIPASAQRMPVLSSIAAVRSLTIETHASLTVDADGKLTLNGDLAVNGELTGLGGIVSQGSERQMFNGNKFRLGSIEVGPAGAILDTDVELTRMLILNGNLEVNSRNLTLISDATNTAMVVNNGAAAVIGTVNIQRYVGPAKNEALGYRHAAAPVVGATVGDLTTTNYSPVINSAFNTKGAVVRPFPTIYGYNEGRVTTTGGARTDFDAGWFSPASEGELLAPLAGYTLNMPAGETFNFSGVLNNGPMTRRELGRGPGLQSGWHLLGNPYPSPLSWTRAFNGDANSPGSGATNLDNAVYVFQSSDKYKGSYASYVRGISINGGTDEIAMGQGFFVRTSAAGQRGSLSLTNAARLQTYVNPIFQRGNEIRPLVRLVLRGATVTAPDEAVVYFESGATSGFDGAFDAYKLTAGNSASLGLEAGASLLSVNGLPMLSTTTVEVPLRVDVVQTGTFTIEASQLLNLPAGTTAWLRDTQTGSLTNLQNQQYSFSASPNGQAGRFYLLVGAAQALPTKTAQNFEHVSVYPNPAHNQVWVKIPSALQNQGITITLSNMLGQQVGQQHIQNVKGDIELSLADLSKGIYTIQIATVTGEATNRRVIVE